MQNTAFSTNKILKLGDRLVDLSQPRIMGILNVTPDSFYDGNRYTHRDAARAQAEKMIAEGAMIVDVGGYSTRPGAEVISEETEMDRVLPVIRQLKSDFPSIAISIDTFRANVASAAVAEGAAMVNDISGGQTDTAMNDVIARERVPYVLMHMRGTPQTMTQLAKYDNIVVEITDFLQKQISRLTTSGISDILVDPGFGFAKTREQNFVLLRNLEALRVLQRPLLVGLSRKSMIWKTLQSTPGEAGNGTTALHAVALLKGVAIIRTHDVKEAMEVVTLMNQLR